MSADHSRSVLRHLLLATVAAIVATLAVVVVAPTAEAVDIPPASIDLFLQTSGPSAGLNVGDWYTSPVAEGGGGTDHIYILTAPDGWPAGTPVTVALYDPESFEDGTATAPAAIDEVRGGAADATKFELRSPTGVVLQTTTFTTSATNGEWYELYTFDPSVTGSGDYILHVSTGDGDAGSTTINDDDNSWRLRWVSDPDCAAGNSGVCTSAQLANGNETDNADGLPGTGDELFAGIQRGSYQHSGSGSVCNTYYFNVDATTPRDGPTGGILAHNFDLDNSGTVDYTDPTGGTHVGTVSGNTTWNGSTDSIRVGDELPTIEGWWSAEICLTPNNQYVFEGPSGTTTYLELQPQVPEIELLKDDGVTEVDRGDTITYTIDFTNPSDIGANPGQALDVDLADAVPTGATYVPASCAISAPFTGSCSFDSGTGRVGFTIDEPVNPGASGQVSFSVTIDADATGSIVNTAVATFDDSLGNSYTATSNTDTDVLRSVIGDLVFEDLDGNGLADDGATGIGGVTVNLFESDGTTLVASTVTAADGSYTFTVTPGDYIVDVDETTMPSAVTLTTANEPLPLTVQSGDVLLNADFGYRLTTDLSVTKTDSLDPVADTGSFTYSITATNNGPIDATGVTVVDTLPAGLTFDAAGSTPGCAEAPAGTVTCDVGSLASGSSTAITIAVDVVAGTEGTITNTVTVSADQDESTPADNIDTEPTTIYLPAIISDFVWYDVDGNGAQDVGEPGLANVTLELYDATGTVLIATLATDADGLYAFTDLAPGDYVVRVDPATLPAGMTVTFDAEGVADGSALVTVASDDVLSTIDFGYTGTGSIGDFVFEDENGNGTLDAGDTTGLAGAQIELAWAGPDGAFGTGDDVVYPTQTTDSTGAYDFVGLPAGAYALDVIAHPAGATLTTGNDPVGVSLAAGEDYDLADFGYVFPSSIGDFVWFDLNGDGVQDGSETGIDAVDVVLYLDDGDGVFEPGTDDTALATQTTSSGDYDFADVAPGNYWVDVDDTTLPAGAVLTTANEPDLVVVTSGTDHDSSDFGYDIVATVTEIVFQDTNANGVVDAGEELVGVDVTFTDPEGTVRTVTTDATGTASAALAPGTVTIDIDDTTLPAGLILTAGTDPTDVMAVSGTTVTDTTGYQPAGTVAEIVFQDTNGNGTIDPGEQLAGVDVDFTVDGTTTTITTDATGTATLTGILPGETVTIDIDDTTLPAGLILTAGTDPTDVMAVSGTTVTDTTGYQPAGTVAEIVFQDTNGNGTIDPGEQLAGVDVDFTVDGTTTTITTDATGTATLTGILPGETVTIDIDDTTLPAGVVLTAGTDPTDVVAVSGTTVTDTTGYALSSSIQITKGPATQEIVSGGTATFTITVENTGTTALTGVTVTDPGFAQCDGFFATLAIGEVQSYSCDVAGVTADFTNVADVEATDPASDTLTDSDSADVTVLTPSFTVTKTPASQQVPVNGDADFTITITNTGETDLSNVAIDDPLATCDATTLAALAIGESHAVNCTTSGVAADFTNTVTVTADDPIGTELTEADSADVVVLSPAISITKDPADQQVVVDGTATFTIMVENTGPLDLTNVIVSDPVAPDCDRTIGALAAGASSSYSCTLASITADFTNQADVAGSDIVGNIVNDSDTADVDVIDPAIKIDKTPDLTSARAGDTVSFTIAVTNTGDVDLTNVVVTDPLTPACDVTYASLVVGQTETSTCSTVATADFTNVANVIADEPTGGTVGDSDDADVDVIAPAISISKGPATQQVIVNGTATFDISVSNAGDSPLADVVISDPLTPDCDNTIAGLAVGETVTYSCTLSGVSAGFTNTADVTADDVTGRPVTDADTADVTVVSGAVEIQKAPDLQLLLAGETATFDITVTNSGPIDLFNVAVTDPLTPACDTAVGTLAAGTSTTISCTSAPITNDFINAATVDAVDAVGNPYTDTDDALVDMISPNIAVAKTPDLQTVVTGGTATFTITVTNTGDTDLTNVVVTDAVAPFCDTTVPVLLVGETVSSSCTLASITADLTNTADVVADAPSGGTVTASDAADVTVLVPSIDIQKTPDLQLSAVGDDVTFTITVTNTGETDLTAVTVTDALVPACDLAIGDLAIGATSIHSCDATGVTADFTNTAAVAGDDPLGNPVTATDTADVDVVAPAISISKTPDLQTLLAGETATFDVTVTNSGDVDLTNVVVSDPLAPGCDASFASLTVGEAQTISCSVADVAADFTNLASVTAETPLGDTVTDDDDALVDVVSPGVEIQKTPDLQQVVSGDDAIFAITVTNTGDQALTGLVVTDPTVPACDSGPFDLAVGGSTSYTCTEAAVTADFTNIAFVAGVDALTNPVSDSDDAAVDVIAPALTISKTPDLQTVVSGGTATFTVTATNTGDVDLTDVVISDPLAPGCDASAPVLTPGESHSTSCTLAAVSGDFTNTATVTADDPLGNPLTASDDGDVTVLVPSIEIQKTPDVQLVALGDDVTFTITVANTGQTDLVNVVVSDPLAPNCDSTIGALAIGETQSYTCDLATPGADFTNTATVSGDDPLGHPTEDSDSADVDVIAPALSISKTPDLQSVPLGDTATFSVQVTNTGNIGLTDVEISDPIAPGCDATVAALAVGATATTTCSITITGDITNVASASALDPNGDPVDGGSDSGDVTALMPAVLVEKTPAIQSIGVGQDVTFTITVTNVGDVALASIDVVDALAPVCDTTVGPLLPGESTSYDCTIADVLADFTNTVDATGVDGNGNVVSSTDTADVVVVPGSISITKSPEAATVVDGGTIVYTITIENTGPADLADVVVTDPTVPACDTTFVQLLIGESQTWTCSDTDVAAADSDPVVNTIDVTATDEAGDPVAASTSSTVDVLVPALTVTKTALPSLVTEGDAAVFEISVMNTGETPLTDVVVTDPSFPACDTTYADLAIGETQSSTCTIDGVVEDTTNTVNATAIDPIGGTVEADASATVVVIHTGELTGFVFTDEDRDGVYEPLDGDAPVTDIDVVITDQAGDAIIVTTDDDGRFEAVVMVGEYTIDVDESDPDFTPGYGLETTGTDGQTVTVADVDVTTAPPVGYGPPPPGSIIGTLWNDVDSDGEIDPNEPLLSGVRVTATGAGDDGVFGTADDIVLTTTTDQGIYRFTSVPAGTYRIEIDQRTLPAGVELATFDLDGTLDGQTTVVVLAGETTSAVDFGQVGAASRSQTNLTESTTATTTGTTTPAVLASTGADSLNLTRLALVSIGTGLLLLALGRRRRLA